ncbi:hypothetical protein GPALN_013165 [Globodera pallida]|nr:hypothetical protein GPALN_013165 [Globodera pallida]
MKCRIFASSMKCCVDEMEEGVGGESFNWALTTGRSRLGAHDWAPGTTGRSQLGAHRERPVVSAQSYPAPSRELRLIRATCGDFLQISTTSRKPLRCISPTYHFAYKAKKYHFAYKAEKYHFAYYSSRRRTTTSVNASCEVFLRLSRPNQGDVVRFCDLKVTTEAALFGQNATSQSLYTAAEADRELANGTLYLDSIK